MRVRQMYAVTLIELIIVVTILAIVLMTAIPGYRWLLQKNQQATAINQLVTALNMTRNQAIGRQQTMTLCPSVDGRHCHGQWQQGMLLLIAKNDQPVHYFAPMPNTARLIWNRNQDWIQISPKGYLKSQPGSFYYCQKDNHLDHTRAVILSNTGRVRVDDNVPNSVCHLHLTAGI